MTELKFTIPAECDGMQLRTFVKNRLGLSARAFSEQKRTDNGILRNGTECRSRDILHAGDELLFMLPQEKTDYPTVERELDVLFENEHYLIVDKPSNMPVHPSPGHDEDSLLNAVAWHYQKNCEEQKIRPLYRLDKDTSGVIVIAKHRIAASSTAIQKRYYAVCEGNLHGSGTIDIPIGLSENSKIVRECGHGERAVTHWRAVASCDGYTLLSLRLETGRTHQIRAHLSHMGHPLAGDDLYGGSLDVIKRQALHCGRLRLSCAALSVDREFSADFPQDMREAFPWLPDFENILNDEL